MAVLLPHAEWKPYPGLGGRPFDRPAAGVWKLLIHTTEGTSITGAEQAYAKFPPHLIWDPATRRLVQHVTLDKGSYALRGSDSEDEPVIQVEVVGFAAQTPLWSQDQVANFAEDVAIPVRHLCPYALQAPVFYGSGYGAASPARFSVEEWETYSGIVGHQHAPAPDVHWDPGRFPVDALLTYIKLKEAPVAADSDAIQEILDISREVAAVLRHTVDLSKLVDRMYIDILGRHRTAEETYWIDSIRNGASVADVETFLISCDEAKAYRQSRV